MTSISSASVSIQTSAHTVPSLPGWFGEVTLPACHLQRQGVLAAIADQVRFARRRFGRYELIDFVAVLLGYAISGERTLERFYERLRASASAFMALFGRDRLPARSTLSRFLASLDQAAVEALPDCFLADLLARPLVKDEHPGGPWDRQENHYLVFDIDGTREAARQRALPQTEDRPVPQRRLRPLCAPGYPGRKRGEAVRTRTTILLTAGQRHEQSVFEALVDHGAVKRAGRGGHGCAPSGWIGDKSASHGKTRRMRRRRHVTP